MKRSAQIVAVAAVVLALLGVDRPKNLGDAVSAVAGCSLHTRASRVRGPALYPGRALRIFVPQSIVLA